MTTFNPLSKKAFDSSLSTIAQSKTALTQAFQDVLTQAVYHAVFHGKADYPNAAMQTVNAHFRRDAKHIRDYLLEFCEPLRATIAKDKDQSKAFQVKKGTKPLENPHDAAMAAIANLPNWDAWAKEKRSNETEPAFYKIADGFTNLMKRAETHKVGIDPGESHIMAALQSFKSLILAGKSLADIRADYDMQIASLKLENATLSNRIETPVAKPAAKPAAKKPTTAKPQKAEAKAKKVA